MPQILLKNQDNDELLDIDQETFDTIENLLLTAVDKEAEWEVVEDVLDKLLAKGRVSATMATIDFTANKPNYHF